MLAFDMAVQVCNSGVTSYTAGVVMRTSRREVMYDIPILGWAKPRFRVLHSVDMVLPILLGCKAQVTETNRSAEIRNETYWDLPRCIVQFVTRKGPETEVAFPNMGNSPLPLRQIRAVSAPHTGGSPFIAHVNH